MQNTPLVRSRILILSVLFSIGLGIIGYYLQLSQLGSSIFPLNTALQHVWFEKTEPEPELGNPRYIVANPDPLEQHNQQKQYPPSDSIGHQYWPVSSNWLDSVFVHPTKILCPDLFADNSLANKPAPYGSFEMPNKPYQSNPNYYSKETDNNPIYNQGSNQSMPQQADNGIMESLGQMPYSVSDMVIEGAQGNSWVVENQIQINVKRLLNDQIDKRINKQ